MRTASAVAALLIIIPFLRVVKGQAEWSAGSRVPLPLFLPITAYC